MEWLGNPRFVSPLDFEQDYVKPLGELFTRCSIDEGRKIIDNFIAFNQKLLARGIIDKSFNVTKNYGMSSTGDIILIDIGEIFDDPEKIARQIRDKAWVKPYVCNEIANVELRLYFLKRMDEEFRV